MSGESFQRYDWNGTEWVPVEDVPSRQEQPTQTPQPMPQQLWPQSMGQPVYVINQGDPGGRAVSLLLAWMLSVMWLVTAPCWFIALGVVAVSATEEAGEGAQTIAAGVAVAATAVITLAPAGFALRATLRKP